MKKFIVGLFLVVSSLSFAAEDFSADIQKDGLLIRPRFNEKRILGYNGHENYRVNNGFTVDEMRFERKLDFVCTSYGFSEVEDYELTPIKEGQKVAEIFGGKFYEAVGEYRNQFSMVENDSKNYLHRRNSRVQSPKSSASSLNGFTIVSDTNNYFPLVFSWILCR